MRGIQRAIVSASLVALVTTTSGLARADDWYGYKILAGDGAAAALLVTSFSLPKKAGTPMRLLSLATYLVVSPVVHATEDRGGVGAGALGLRVLAPVGLGLVGIGVGAAASSRGLDGLGTTLLGGLIGVTFGVITAIAIDTAAFARSPAKIGQTSGALLPGPSFYVPFGAAF